MPYELDLLACRRALVQRQVDGQFDSMESLARACGISRSTASRFFSGRNTSLAVTLKILAALGAAFEEVARPVDIAGAA
jgi:transcriptional regulator with XRE-family HTH domain